MTEPPFASEFVRALYDRPLFALIDEARSVHREHHPENEVQLCTLLSVKTGGCPEDCAYCPQSSHYDTDVGPEKMLDVDEVLAAARRAKEHGLDALLHGRGVARGEGRPGVRSRARRWCAA